MSASYGFKDLVLALLCVATAAASFSAEPAPYRRGKYLALVVAVTDYDGTLPRVDVSKGAREMETALRAHAMRLGYEPKTHTIVEVMLDNLQGKTAPTIEAVLRRMNALADQSIDADDALVFYFTGHGMIGQQDEIILLGSGARSQNDDTYWIQMRRIESRMKSAKAAMRIIFVDACQGTAELSPDAVAALATRPALLGEKSISLLQATEIAYFFSASTREYSYIDKAAGMGYYTKHLARALLDPGSGLQLQELGKPIQFTDDLQLYLLYSVWGDVYAHEKGAVQRPSHKYEGSLGRFRLETAAAAGAAAPAPAPAATPTPSTTYAQLPAASGDQPKRVAALRLKTNLRKSEKFRPDAIEAVLVEARSGETAISDRPTSFERDMLNACAALDLAAGSQIEWTSLATLAECK